MTLNLTPGGLLAAVQDHWDRQGWPLADRDRFRMEDDDLGGLTADEAAALDALSESDRDALEALSADELAILLGDEDEVDEDELSDPVKAILKKNRGELRDVKKARRAAESNASREKARADRAEAEIARLKGKKPPENAPEVDADEIRRQANDEASKAANQRIVRAEVKAAAGGKFADPALAVRLVDLDEITVYDDGSVDEDAIVEQLEEILEKNPGLAAKAVRKRPKPPKGQGQHGQAATGADAGKAEAARRFGQREAAGAK